MATLVESVALYAVVLEDCARNMHVGEESLIEDLECGHSGGLTFAQMTAHSHFTDVDWGLVKTIASDTDYRTIHEIARVLYREDDQIVRAEGLLHTIGKRPLGVWAKPIRAHWRQVRHAIQNFEQMGMTVTTDRLNDIAEQAYMNGSGMSLDETRRRFGSRWDDLMADDDLPVPYVVTGTVGQSAR